MLPRSSAKRRSGRSAASCARRRTEPLATTAPVPDANFYRGDFGGFDLRWEQHTEFFSVTVIREGVGPEPFVDTAFGLLPEDWVAAMPGCLVVATHAAILGTDSAAPSPTQLRDWFEGQLVVETAADGLEALRLAARNDYALILMDIQLPEISGIDLTREIKNYEALRSIPIIAVTAFAMKGDEERIRKGGCEAYISKPISVAKFIETVKHYLGDGDGNAGCRPNGHSRGSR